MNGSLAEQLNNWKKKHTPKEQPQKKKRKKTEQLSEQDIRELMGTNGPRYVRKKGGAYIQR